MRIILTGGGTAGHVNPALAIAEDFRKNLPNTEILFFGTKNGMEKALVSAAGYAYFEIEAMGLSRSLSLKNLRALWLAYASPRKARRLLFELNPDLVVGTGGYVCWPVLSAAASLGLPTAVHESNAIPGLTVRRLARRVDLVLLNFSEAAACLPSSAKTLHVGNPLRSGFSSITREEARRRLGIPGEARLTVSFGGSLGAAAINEAVLDVFEGYTLKDGSAYHIHSAGSRYIEEMKEKIKKRFGALPKRIEVREYLHEMPTLMAAADLLICRAGAMTVTELALSRRAAILIPSPNVANDHQTKNAEALATLGGALLVRESELQKTELAEQVRALLYDDKRRCAMEQAAKEFGFPDANRRVYAALLKLMKAKGKGRR